MFHSAQRWQGSPLAAARPLELAVVVPVLNEAGNVHALLAALDRALGEVAWEVLFVDDNSPDGTADIIRAIGRERRDVRVLQRVGRRGLASAVVEGMLASAAPVVAVIDGDMQHDPDLLPALYRAVASGGHDLAVGSRYVAQGGVGDWDARRHAVSRGANWLARRLTGTDLADPMSGFFAVSRAALMGALPKLSGEGFKILLDIVASSPRALRIVELPYVFRDRAAGVSKLDLMVAAEYGKLLADKALGHIVPVRLLLFGCVGALGVGVHLGLLGALLAAGAAFVWAQAAAVLGAMTFNFALNNVFTYADRRLRGRKLLAGLLSFYAICSAGAVANVGVGSLIHGNDHSWWLAGMAGALIGSVWNFAATSVVTWRR